MLATIYRFSDSYRLYWRARVDGKPKSRMKDFKSYAEAKREGDKVAADLAKGKATGLSPGQTSEKLNFTRQKKCAHCSIVRASKQSSAICFPLSRWAGWAGCDYRKSCASDVGGHLGRAGTNAAFRPDA